MVSLREITSRETTGRRSPSLGAAIGRHAHVLPLCTGMPGSRVTSRCSSHPANSNPQIKTVAARSGDFPMPFVKFFIRPSSRTDTVSYALNTAWLEELRWKVVLQSERFPANQGDGAFQSAGGKTTGQNLGLGASNSNATEKYSDAVSSTRITRHFCSAWFCGFTRSMGWPSCTSIFIFSKPPCALTTCVSASSRRAWRWVSSAITVTFICSITRSLRRRSLGLEGLSNLAPNLSELYPYHSQVSAFRLA